MEAPLPALRPDGYRPHALHRSDRNWPTSNCHIDLWIEVLASLGHDPHAVLSFVVTQDFEGDQFTFLRVPAEDLDLLFGISVQELSIYDRVELHVREQIRRGRLPLVEVDSYFLPDTQGVAYGTEHAKTLIGMNRIDIAGRTLDYFHNEGYFHLQGADFDGLFGCGAGGLVPYSEFAKFGPVTPEKELGRLAVGRLLHHLARRPAGNPFVAFRSALPGHVERLLALPEADFHKYAFNTSRQFGATFGLLAAHLEWLGDRAGLRAPGAIEAASRISEGAKVLQFQLARAVARRSAHGLQDTVDRLADAYETLFHDLPQTFGRLETTYAADARQPASPRSAHRPPDRVRH